MVSEAREEAPAGADCSSGASLPLSPRLSNRADLPHQAQLILEGPRLGDLACLYVVHGDARKFHLLASRGYTRVLPLVGCTGSPASYHLIPLGYEVLYGAYHVREALTEIGCLLLGGLGLLGDEELFCGAEVTGMVPELFLLPTHWRLVLLERHASPPSRPLSPTGRATPCMMPSTRDPAHLDTTLCSNR